MAENEVGRSTWYEWDEAYIDAYLNNPKGGQLQALQACGHPNPTKQFANVIHRRLRDRIEKELNELIKDGAAVGYKVLRLLAEDSDNDGVRLNAAKALMDYAGKKPSDVLVVHEVRDEAELDKEIQRLSKIIQDAEGRIIEGEIDEH